MRFIAALLAATLPLLSSAGEAQLLPAGKFAARDGRPGPGKTWEVTDAQGRALAAALNAIAAKNPIVIDYEHQTMHAAENGQPAPAAGWVTSVDWRAGTGLYAKVNWTDRAKALIDAGEYRYISPVIAYDAKTGAIANVHMAALVNHPALLGMDAVVAKCSAHFEQAHPPEKHMDILVALATLFGLAAGTTPEQLMVVMTSLKAQADEIVALKTKLGLPADAAVAALATAVEALKTNVKTDPTTLQTMQALQTQVAALTGQINNRDVAELVDGAIAAHKLAPVQKAWAIELGTQSIASLRAYIAATPAIAGLGGQSGGQDPGDPAPGALNRTQALLASQLGLDPTKFSAALTAA